MNWKLIVSFVVGAGVGVGASYSYFKKRCDKLVESETEELRKYFMDKIEEAAEVAKTEDIAKDFDAEEAKQEAADSVNGYEKAKEDYSGYFGEDPKKRAERLARENARRKEIELEGPHTISDDEYYEEQQFDKITLTYFEDDGVFINAEEEVVPEALSLIGEDNLKYVGEFEEDILFVRNETYGAVIEVIFNHGSYKAYIGEE